MHYFVKLLCLALLGSVTCEDADHVMQKRSLSHGLGGHSPWAVAGGPGHSPWAVAGGPGFGWNAPPASQFGKNPAFGWQNGLESPFSSRLALSTVPGFNARSSLAAGLAQPDIHSATAEAHHRYSAPLSNAYHGPYNALSFGHPKPYCSC